MKLKHFIERERKGLIILLYIAIMIGIALAIKNCMPDKEYDPEYEEYLNDVYDGASRYDPV